IHCRRWFRRESAWRVWKVNEVPVLVHGVVPIPDVLAGARIGRWRVAVTWTIRNIAGTGVTLNAVGPHRGIEERNECFLTCGSARNPVRIFRVEFEKCIDSHT